MTLVQMDMRRIRGWRSFHNVFARAFGFPSFYGRNMNAWIDCMTSLDCPEDGMSTVHAVPPGVVTLQLDHVDDLCRRFPELFDAMVECAAFVNWRRIELGQPAVLALSFWKTAPTEA